MGKPVQMWYKNVYETTNTVIPLDKITTQVLSTDIMFNYESFFLFVTNIVHYFLYIHMHCQYMCYHHNIL